MINKKGFTLVEILVVVALISVIMIIAIPSIMSVNKKMNEREFAAKKELIISAAEMYGKDNKDSLFPGSSTTSSVTVQVLLDNKYIEPDKDNKVYSPVDNSVLNTHSIKLKLIKLTVVAEW